MAPGYWLTLLACACFLAGSVRVDKEVGNLDSDDEQDSAEGSFDCPSECSTCCKKVNSLGWQDKSKFKCLLPKEKASLDFKLPGRTCSAASIRASKPDEAKVECDFTTSEKGAWRALGSCFESSHESAAVASTQGAYLMFSPENSGTLFLQWSKEKQSGALAFFEPDPMKVPSTSFKYNGEGMKTQLVRNLGVDRHGYHGGWVQFIRQGFKVGATLTVLNDQPSRHLQCSVYLLENQKSASAGNIVHMKTGRAEVLNDKDAVAVVGADNHDLDARQMNHGLFVRKGREAGAAEKL